MTNEQKAVVEALACQHGNAKVLPVAGSKSILACGWDDNTITLHRSGEVTGTPLSRWFYVPEHVGRQDAIHARVGARGAWPERLRYAIDEEIAEAHELDAIRSLLTASGLMP